jgi:hypothetical protein
VERLASKRYRGSERRLGRRRRCSALIKDSQQLSIPTVDHVDTPSAAGRM